MIGLISPYASVSAPEGTLDCDGTQYLRVDYPELYAALNSAYIDDADHFTVPDLTDRYVKGAGSESVGATGGEDTVTLSIAQIPEHDHAYSQYTFGIDIESVGVPDPTGVGQPLVPQTTGTRGGGQSHENNPPYHVMKWCIVTGR